MTSSTDAVCGGRHDASRVWTEDDWADERTAGPYPTGELLSERAAIRLADEHGLELVRIKPSLVLGPLLHAEQPTSLESIRKLMARELPRCRTSTTRSSTLVTWPPPTAWRWSIPTPPVSATSSPVSTAGWASWRRCWPSGSTTAATASPPRRLPYAAMWLIARFDGTIRLALNYVGLRHEMSTAKARTELGWSPRPVTDTVLEAAESL